MCIIFVHVGCLKVMTGRINFVLDLRPLVFMLNHCMKKKYIMIMGFAKKKLYSLYIALLYIYIIICGRIIHRFGEDTHQNIILSEVKYQRC